MSGSLLGDVAAQVGGSLVGLFTPSKVDLYKVPDGAYVVVNGLFPVCVKPDAAEATEALDELSPSSMLNMLTGSDVARGKFVGEETLNGVPVKHYVIDGDTFLTRRTEQHRSEAERIRRRVVVGRGCRSVC